MMQRSNVDHHNIIRMMPASSIINALNSFAGLFFAPVHGRPIVYIISWVFTCDKEVLQPVGSEHCTYCSLELPLSARQVILQQRLPRGAERRHEVPKEYKQKQKMMCRKSFG